MTAFCGWPGGGNYFFLAPEFATTGAVAPKSATVATVINVGQPNYMQVLTYQDATLDTASWQVPIPKDQAVSKVRFNIYWTAVSTPAGQVNWKIGARAFSDGDDLNVAIAMNNNFDTWANGYYLYITDDIDITPEGAPQRKDLLWVVVDRDGVADAYNNSCYLLAVKGEYL